MKYATLLFCLLSSNLALAHGEPHYFCGYLATLEAATPGAKYSDAEKLFRDDGAEIVAKCRLDGGSLALVFRYPGGNNQALLFSPLAQ